MRGGYVTSAASWSVAVECNRARVAAGYVSLLPCDQEQATFELDRTTARVLQKELAS
eukprot:COSAG02_NODE_3621_length_6458_cov_23.823243_6_plen_57_part_00